jgi:hypothetical protein
MRRLVAVVFLSIVLLPVLGSGVRAAPPARIRLETLVPGSTLAFVGLEDVGTWGERWKKTAMAKLIAEPEIQAFAGPIVEDVKKLLTPAPAAPGEPAPPSPVPPEVGEVFEVLQQLQGLSGQAAVALVGWPQDGPPSVAACLDFGDHLGDFVAFLTRFEAAAKAKGKPLVSSTTHGGRTWWSVGGEKGGLRATTIGTAIFASTDALWLESVAASEAAPLKGSLAEEPSFQRVRERGGAKDAALFAFVNVPEVIERVPMPEDARRIANALGLDAVHGAGYGCAFKGDGFLDTIVIDAPKPDHGLFTVLAMKPVSHAALSMAPSSALYYSESGFRFADAVPKVREIVGKVAPEISPKIERFFAQANEVLGVDVEKDLLAGLADELAVWFGLPPTGGVFPEAAICAAVKDPKAFEAVMEKAVDGIARRAARDGRVVVKTRTLDYRGTPLHVIDLAGAGKDVIPFTPTWALLGDRLVVTLVPHTMKEIVLRRAAKEAGLAGEEDVKALLSEAPAGHGGFEYVDLQAITTFLYDTGVPALQTALKPNLLPVPVRLDWAQLPASRTVRPYFRSFAGFATSDDEGVRVSIHAPLPLTPMLFAAAAAAAGTLGSRVPAIASRRLTEVPSEAVDPALRALAEGQMQALADAIEIYRLQNNKVPERLDALLDKDSRTGEPYLEKLPLDPWRGPYDYATPSTQTYRISSAGPDRTWGTPDDLVFPTQEEPK